MRQNNNPNTLNKSALLTAQRMYLADEAAVSTGVPSTVLMQNAGLAAAIVVANHWAKGRVTILCGPGNNGGDGFVAAYYLYQWGWPVTVGLLGCVSNLTDDAKYHAKRYQGEIHQLNINLLDNAQLVVDAIFGAGLKRPLEGVVRNIAISIQDKKLPVCAVDVPSGLDGNTGQIIGETVIPAHHTITFFRKKLGHVLLPGKILCGNITLADIGIPSEVLYSVGTDAHENLPSLWHFHMPWLQASQHKYNRGHVLVLGSTNMVGASRLSALAAARSGAGLVTVAAPDAVLPVYMGTLTSVLVSALNNNTDLINLLSDNRKNAIVVGPGAGISTTTKNQVLKALSTKRPVVLDADALTVFQDDPQALFNAIQGPCVLTPHEGEFKRIFNIQGSKLQRAQTAAAICGAVVVLKGADTVIASPKGDVFINTNAPAWLATAGSGDVLTGIIAGLLAQGMPVFYAAAAGVWLHGKAASFCGFGMLAEDLPKALTKALQDLNYKYSETKPQVMDQHISLAELRTYL